MGKPRLTNLDELLKSHVGTLHLWLVNCQHIEINHITNYNIYNNINNTIITFIITIK